MTSEKTITWRGQALMVTDPGDGTFEVRKEGEAAVAVFDHAAYAWAATPKWLQEIGGATLGLGEVLLLGMFEP